MTKKVRKFRIIGICSIILIILLVSAFIGQGIITRAANTFNNEGMTADANPGGANFDGGGFSYSNDALAAAGFASGTAVKVNGVTFPWPTVSAGTSDNWQAAGQIIPVTGSGLNLAFLGSATHGASSGTATITYTDNTTQTFTLAFSDWTLHSGKSPILPGNTVAVSTAYRDSTAGQQAVKTYIFYTSVGLQTGKTLQSVTLPNTVSPGSLHIFAVAVSASSSNGLNNEGVSSDANPGGANFDGGGFSYSNDALAAAGFTSGTAVKVNGVTFPWPTVADNTTDNWQAAGQVVPIPTNGTTLAFLGASTSGPASGTATITYTDSTTQTFTLAFGDWTLNGGRSSVLSGNAVAAAIPHRNSSAGSQAVKTYVFYTSIGLQSGKTIKSVTLPASVNQGSLHIFAVATSSTAFSPFSNEGISADANPGSANFDGGNNSYSNDALTAAGFAAGAPIKFNGVTFQWPTVAAGVQDNWQATGQVVPIPTNGTTLAFLGASSGGPSSGTATITYTDNSTQTFTLGFSDWTLAAGKAQAMQGNSVAVATPYRNLPSGKQIVTTYVFYTSVALQAGKTISSVTLPNSAGPGQLHVFTIATSNTASTPFDHESISSDANPGSANFDNGGNSYSKDALAAAGFAPGAAVTVNGVTFQWPAVALGVYDNWQAAGQVIPVYGNGSTLAFLGASSNGSASGTATITYTDSSTQTFTLGFSDWTLAAGAGSVIPGNRVAVMTPYRNRASGKQMVNTYMFYASVTLQAGKTIQSVTLPSNIAQGQLHIFAISLQDVPALTQGSSWPTYLWNGHTGDNTDETVLNASNFSALKVQWTAHGSMGMSMQPIEANNAVYWGSWDGTMHATRTDGVALWNTPIGQTTAPGCNPRTAAIADTATFGTIGSTSVVFVGGGGNVQGADGNDDFYALNANTGQIIWKTALGPAPSTFQWGSPVLYNGSLYIGISSFGDCPLVQGKIVQLDAATGTMQHSFSTVPNGCVGGGIWGTPTVTSDGKVFVATGTFDSGCKQGEPYAAAVLEFNASDLSLVDHWQIPLQVISGTDIEFGSAPTIFDFTSAGIAHHYVGISAKDGNFYAFDRNSLGSGPVWTAPIDPTTGACPQCGNGAISPAVWDGTTIYVAAGRTTIKGAACRGTVQALDPATGQAKWQDCLTSGSVLGPLAAVPGVVIAAQGTKIDALSMSTGAVLFEFTDPTPGSVFFSGVSVANGQMYAANLDGNFYAFGL